MTSELVNEFGWVCDYVRQTQLLQTTQALLEWDQQTYLPSSAADYRADQISYLAGEVHRRKTLPELGARLAEIAGSRWILNADSDAQTTIRQLKRDFDRSSRLSARLVEDLARACSLGQQIWIEARRKKAFHLFAPALQEILKLKREQAAALATNGQSRLYDALLDEYEQGARADEITKLFSGLVSELRPLLERVRNATSRPTVGILQREYPRPAQEEFGRYAAQTIGFDFSRGRLDETHHPFCTELGPNDCRILTRYDERYFSTAFFGILHEAGHGMYEQGLRREQYGLPPGQFCSLGVHESQSRLWENLVGRSLDFWRFFLDKAKEQFSQALSGVTLDQFVGAINDVRPSLIRVEADEVTYNLHIAIRFELESAAVDGDLDVDEMPGAWNEKYREYLGITPADDAQGILQDIHWSAGLFGYFPTYTLGNLYASQLFEAAERDMGQISSMFSVGDFAPLRGWLTDKVYRQGQTLPPADLISQATGQPATHGPLLRHLNSKCSRIYGL